MKGRIPQAPWQIKPGCNLCRIRPDCRVFGHFWGTSTWDRWVCVTVVTWLFPICHAYVHIQKNMCIFNLIRKMNNNEPKKSGGLWNVNHAVPECRHMGMGQAMTCWGILGGWTSINPSYFAVHQGIPWVLIFPLAPPKTVRRISQWVPVPFRTAGSRDLVGVMKIVQMGPGTVASWTFFDRFHPKRPWMHRFSTEKILESLEVHWSLAVFSHVRFFFWRFNWRSFRVSSASRGVFWGCWGAPERRSFLVSMSEIEAWIGRWYKSMF